MNNGQYQPPYQQPYQPQYQPVPPAESQNSGLAMTSMIFGIVSLVVCWCGGPLFGIVAVILALVDRSKCGKMTGMAIAGLICGIISCVLCIIVLVIYIIAMATGALAGDTCDVSGFSEITTYTYYNFVNFIASRR